MTERIPDWLRELQAEEQQRRDRLPEVKASLMAALKRRKIAFVGISYDGEGDSGQIDDVTATNKAGEMVEIKGDVRLRPERKLQSLSEAIEAFAWHILAVYHDGFVNNDGGLGTIEIDVVKGTVTLDHNDRISDYCNTVTEV